MIAGLHLGEVTFGLMSFAMPVLVALVYICLCSLFQEPQRRQFNAIMLAGAGAAYLNGGLGALEFVFTTALTFCAYRGLNSYRYIGIGWLMHSGWDFVHHVHGHPIIPFYAASSLGCAICDPVIAAWCFAGGPSLLRIRRSGIA